MRKYVCQLVKTSIIITECRASAYMAINMPPYDEPMLAGEELRAAVEEWQAKRSHASGAPRLTTGFLDGTHPIVDAYELKASRKARLTPHIWLVQPHMSHD